jgi:hypothetical protein
MRIALALLAVVALAACGPKLVSSTSDNVAFQYSGDQSRDVEERARTECGNHGKRARLRSLNTQPDGKRLAIYDCV